ncbi:unnamed protein product [Miscanthus lutarioriparius]|uniref:KIB1-4 beta-propeller domain-containing protein n=1 Tax=Miscanthus lutarioriparius TaxID=422564 RepID=A0A811N884_9POAL|nr:unnamed protein product [Miscanthus lutarioriparius]
MPAAGGRGSGRVIMVSTGSSARSAAPVRRTRRGQGDRRRRDVPIVQHPQQASAAQEGGRDEGSPILDRAAGLGPHGGPRRRRDFPVGPVHRRKDQPAPRPRGFPRRRRRPQEQEVPSLVQVASPSSSSKPQLPRPGRRLCRHGALVLPAWGQRDGEDVDRQWLKHEYGTVDGMSRLAWSLTSVGNKFLMDLVWRTDNCKVVTLEFSPEPQFTVIPVEAVDRDSWPWPPHNGTSKYAWVESQGCLFYVRFCYSDCSLGNRSIVSVEVSKLDLLARAWAKVGTLDGRAFLLVHPWIHMKPAPA